MPTHLDAIAKKIIEELQADGRSSYAAIGKSVGLSEAAVRNRVQKLSESGLLQIVAVTDPLKLGFSRQAMIGIRCTGDTERLARQLAEHPEIDYVVLTAGTYDI
ncbi:Lrp/AsnC family transcriptional regulator, partial [Gordonia otitidis]